MYYRNKLSFMACLIVASALCAAGCVQAQTGTQSVVAASALKELPLKAWGTYNRSYLAPCCLVDRFLGQQFVFPIVISQQRQALMSVRNAPAEPKQSTRLMPVYLQRRAMGLAPVQAADDDHAASGPRAIQNRRVHLTDANAEGLLWTYKVAFSPAALSQKNAVLKSEDITGVNRADTDPSTAWSAGEATIDCFPAFADPEGDGLLMRVTLVNNSKSVQIYCVDLLAGMDTPGILFTPDNFVVQAPPGQTSAVIGHAKSRAVFALAATGLPFHTRCYRVSEAYFAPAGAIARRDEAGAAIPNGLLAVNDSLPASDNAADQKEIEREKKKADKKEKQLEDAQEKGIETNKPSPPQPADVPARPREESESQYALNRVDNIAVAPGQSVTLYLSIGVGKDADTARISAQTLLSVTGDLKGSDAYTSALKAHQEARFHSGLNSLERLMAQSLANTPDLEGRRLGVSTRQLRAGHTGSLYDPNHDALMAVGWINYRATFAAAQLNAWFQTKNNADDISGIPLRNPRATPPTNLFALWDLYQRTHDRAMLKRYYPFARRRYLEMLAAGRPKEDIWLFSWPQTARDAVFIPGSVSTNGAEVRAASILKDTKDTGESVVSGAPDYAAYVIRAASLMQAIAQLTDQTNAETRQYAVDALETTRALNATLWDPTTKIYQAHPTPESKLPPGRADTLASFLPLIAGTEASTPEQRAAMLQTLTNPDTFWSPYGLRSVSKSSPLYRADDGASGAVRFGINWLFWKALLDIGEIETAHKLAVVLLQAYDKAQTTSGVCPEWLDGDTGAGGGLEDYAGDACALLALWSAYHQEGVVTGGWNVTIFDSSYFKTRDSYHLVVRRLQQQGNVTLLCGLGKPNSKYLLSGAISGSQTTDADGVLTLILPQDNTTLVVDIAPAN